MGGGTFIPEQRNWSWWQDDAAEPTTAIGTENTKPTLANNTSIIRLRHTIAETGAKTNNACTCTYEYSTDESTWHAFGDGVWNYADGQATDGNTLTGLKNSDSVVAGEYLETGLQAQVLTASTITEIDFAFVPGGSVASNTTYYFRMICDGNTTALGAGETHPQVLTASGPTTNYQNVAGSMPTAAGSLRRGISFSLTGASPAPAGSLVKKTMVSVVGDMLAASGTLFRGFFLSIAGNMPQAGGDVSSRFVVLQAVFGNIPAAAGNLARGIKTTVTGAMPSQTGDIWRKSKKVLFGDLPQSTSGLVKKTASLFQKSMPAPSGDVAAGFKAYQSAAGTLGAIAGAVATRFIEAGSAVRRICKVVGMGLRKIIGG